LPRQRIVLVDDPDDLAGALERIDDEVIGIDVERADSANYHRRAALVQVGDADDVVLVDPLAIPEPVALAELVRDRFVVLHAIENDIVPLDALGVAMPRVADTAVAAGLLGLPPGLGDLLMEVLGVELHTDKSRYQRADWSARPLTEGMIAYAAGDVLDLPALWRELDARLADAGRTEWYEQELEATIATARADTRHWERTRGAGRLDPQQRAVLRALWEAREELCRTHDIAPNRLVHDRTLVALAEDPATDEQDLVGRDPQRRRGPVREHAATLLAAQRGGLESDPVPSSSQGRWTDEQRTAFDRMRRHRSDAADDLGIDPGLLCPSRQLRAAVADAPSSAAEFAAAADLRPWQQELLLEDLWEIWVEDVVDVAEEDAA
jgi:ribonuclease D